MNTSPSPIKYDLLLAKQTITMRTLPPVAQKQLVEQATPEEVARLGKADVPYEMIKMFAKRLGEVLRADLDDHELARLNLVEADDEKAAEHLEAGLKVGDIRVCNSLGILYQEKGKTEQAVELFERGQDAGARNSLGGYLFQRKQYQAAELKFREAAALCLEENNPIAGYVMLNAGRAFQAMGNKEKAVELYRKAIDCGYYEAFPHLCEVQIENGRQDLAYELVNEGMRRLNGHSIFQSILMFLDSGEKAKADDHLRLYHNLGYTLTDDHKRMLMTFSAPAPSSSAPKN